MKLGRLWKIFVIVVALVTTLSVTGVSYGLTSPVLYVSTTPVYTAACSDPFHWTFTNDDGKINNSIYDSGDNGGGTEYDHWGLTSSDDPGAFKFPPDPLNIQPGVVYTNFNRYTKDVAITSAAKSADAQSITVSIQNAYPYYYPTVFFAFGCDNGAVGTIEAIEIDEDPNDSTLPEPDDIPELTVSYSGIYVSQQIPANGEAVGALHILVNQTAAMNTTYNIKLSITTSCCKEQTQTCGTSYAKSNTAGITARCFTLDGFSNWGWTNGIIQAIPGTYVWPLIAGAGNDCGSGKQIGIATLVVSQVTTNNGKTTATVEVSYNLTGGSNMSNTHLYLGKTKYPLKNGKPSVSPGQYPYYHNSPISPTYDYYKIVGLDITGGFYAIVHAGACWNP